MSKLTEENAIQIELELNLESGDIAADREMTRAEEIYLGVPRTPLLAIHLEVFPDYPTLILYKQEIGVATKPNEGFFFATQEDAHEDRYNQWAGMQMVRMQGQVPFLGERCAATFTGWSPGKPEQAWSMSVEPSTIRNLFSAASVPLLLRPRLADLPPETEGGRSPGKCIKSLGVCEVRWINSIQFQGTTTLKNIDGHKLRNLARKREAEDAAEEQAKREANRGVF